MLGFPAAEQLQGRIFEEIVAYLEKLEPGLTKI